MELEDHQLLSTKYRTPSIYQPPPSWVRRRAQSLRRADRVAVLGQVSGTRSKNSPLRGAEAWRAGERLERAVGGVFESVFCTEHESHSNVRRGTKSQPSWVVADFD